MFLFPLVEVAFAVNRDNRRKAEWNEKHLKLSSKIESSNLMAVQTNASVKTSTRWPFRRKPSGRCDATDELLKGENVMFCFLVWKHNTKPVLKLCLENLTLF